MYDEVLRFGLSLYISTAPPPPPPGQFRETQMSDVSINTALEYAQKLCTYTSSYVHLYEANVVTSGELVVEVSNNQTGMGNLHSTLPCSAAIVAAVVACVDLEEEDRGEFCYHCSPAPLPTRRS